MPDAYTNFAVSTVSTPPTPSTSGTTLTIQPGHGTRFPAAPFNATIWPAATAPDPGNAEIVRVTDRTGDTLTITRAQESTAPRTITTGDTIAATITAKTLTDIILTRTTGTATPAAAADRLRGVNSSGGEFNPTAAPGTYGTDWHFDSLASMQYLASRGHTTIRVPFLWERIQSPTDLAKLQAMVERAGTAQLQVILDMHNYGRLQGATIGSAGGPTAADFASTWAQLSAAFAGSPTVAGYGLMNEPHGLAAGVWKAASQAAVTAIRATGDPKRIIVAGDNYSGAAAWVTNNGPTAWINDPAGNTTYEAHHYWDANHSGTYTATYAAEVTASTAAGYTAGTNTDSLTTRILTELAVFTGWCTQNGVQGFIGEVGWPNSADVAAWNATAAAWYTAADAAGLSVTAWSTSEWWGTYTQSLYATSGGALATPNPQAAVVEAHPGIPPKTRLIDGGSAATRQTLIQPRRGTAAQWTATNPILATAERGIETDTSREKLGDGATRWASLPYVDALAAANITGTLDARYTRQSNNLADLTDTAASRTNLGVAPAPWKVWAALVDYPYAVIQGTWAFTASSSSPLNMNMSNTSATVNDGAVWLVDLTPGTWTVTIYTKGQTNGGIATIDISLDGGATWITVGTVDTYAAAATAQQTAIPGVAVPKAGAAQMRLRALTKNASSTAYAIAVSAASWRRTS